MSNYGLILLAEDNVVNQTVTTLLLSKLGYTVEIAANGRQAVDAVRSRKNYLVILMDCMMPEMDGFEASRAIREIQKQYDVYTPIIAVTAMAMAGDHERCIQAGMDDYMTKPINKEILSIKISHWSKQETVSRNQSLAEQHPLSSSVTASAPLDLNALTAFYETTDLREILASFMKATPAILDELQLAVAARDAGVTIHLAHELKSSGTTLGAKDLVKLALYLQHLAGTRNWPEIEQTTQDLYVSYQQVEKFIRSKLSISKV